MVQNQLIGHPMDVAQAYNVLYKDVGVHKTAEHLYMLQQQLPTNFKKKSMMSLRSSTRTDHVESQG